MVTIIKKGMTPEEIKKAMDAIATPAKKRDISEFCGVIKLTIDPLAYQKAIRDEWK